MIMSDKSIDCAAKIRLLENEILLLNILLLKSPKSPSLWQHRKWCLSRLVSLHADIDGTTSYMNMNSNRVLLAELALCERFADAHSKNYYAWTHRLWLLEHFMTGPGSGAGGESSALLLSAESRGIHAYVLQHPSEFCAMNYLLHVLLHRMGVSGRSPRGQGAQYSEEASLLLYQSLLASVQLLLVRPGHESLWLYHRSLCSLYYSYVTAALRCCPPGHPGGGEATPVQVPESAYTYACTPSELQADWSALSQWYSARAGGRPAI